MPNNPKAKENLKPFVKGKSGNPNGRPPKVFTDLARQFQQEGYRAVTKREITEALEVLIGLPEHKLKEILTDPNQPVLFKVLIRSLVSKDGVSTIESILNRVHGKPTQSIETEFSTKPETIVGFNVIIKGKDS
jgi:hypothetical protein